MFSHVKEAKADPILGLSVAFNACQAHDKVNLGIGAYRDNEGKPVVFKAVQKAEADLLQEMYEGKANKEYLPSTGHPGFIEAAKTLTLGTDKDRFSTVQSVGGTGALKIAFDFIKKFTHNFPDDVHAGARPYPDLQNYKVLVSDPTWPNHIGVANDCGFEVAFYDYLNSDTLSVDEGKMYKDLDSKMTNRSIVLLHAIGHNPTGADISPETFQKVLNLIEARGAIALIDMAYQGFCSGSLEDDLVNLKLALPMKNLSLIIAQSFSKNMGMYGERLGAVHFASPSPEAAKTMMSQLSTVVRKIYSNPPRHPADVAHKVMTKYYKEWTEELREVAGRIMKMRQTLRDQLVVACPQPGDWKHITDQNGMFAYTGLKPDEVKSLINDHHIFLAGSGRISVAGLNDSNVEKVVKDISAVRTKAAKI